MERAKPIIYVMFPVDFFRRPAVIRMITKWERAVEWLFFLVAMAREAQAGGKLILDGKAVTPEELEFLHRNPIPVEFIEYIVSTGWFNLENGILRLTKPTDWYRPKSKEPESEAERSAERREHAMRSELLDQLANEDDHTSTAGRPQGDRRGPNSTAERPLETAHNIRQYKLIEDKSTDPENAACSVQSRESNENQGLDSGQGKQALMVAGKVTISVVANRYAEEIRKTFKAFSPKIHEADELQTVHLDLTKRKSRWDECFSDDDVLLGLSLAVKHADALRQAGRGPSKLVAWIVQLMRTKYVEQAHEWRKLSAKAVKMGFDPLDPPEPDLSELQRKPR